MPIYPVKCTRCGRTDEKFARPSECNSILCECGQPAPIDWSRMRISQGSQKKYIGRRSTSLLYQFDPPDVKGMVDLLGPIGEQCCQKDGSVRFENRGQARQFNRRMAQLKRRADEKAQARKASKTPAEKVIKT